MYRPWRADAAIVDKQSNQEVGNPNGVLIIQRPVDHALADNNLRRDRDIVAPDHVFGLQKHPNLLQRLWYVEGVGYGSSGYLQQHIAGVNTSIVARATAATCNATTWF